MEYAQKEKEVPFYGVWDRLKPEKKRELLNDLQRVFDVATEYLKTSAVKIDVEKAMKDHEYALGLFKTAEETLESELSAIKFAKAKAAKRGMSFGVETCSSQTLLVSYVDPFVSWARRKERIIAIQRKVERRREEVMPEEKRESKLKLGEERLIPVKKEPLALVTTVARYPTDEKAVASFCAKVFRKAKKLRVEGNDLIFEFGGGESVVVTITAGLDKLTSVDLSKRKNWTILREALEKSLLESPEALLKVADIWFVSKGNLIKWTEIKGTRGREERDSLGLTPLVKLALTLDYFLFDKRAQRYYRKQKNIEAAKEICQRVFPYHVRFMGPFSAESRPLDIYLAVMAAQAHLGLSLREQDGLAGPYTLRKAREATHS